MRARLVLALIAAVLTGCNQDGAPARLALVGVLPLELDVPGFGGFSGLELSEDGTRFVAVGDNGRFLRGQITRVDGRAVQAKRLELTPMRGALPGPLRKGQGDAEGLALAPDGRLYVSYEGETRVWAYDGPGAAPQILPRHPDFARMPGNGGLEALAMARDGSLFTLAEHSGRRDWPIPLYRLAGSQWQVVTMVERRAPFVPVGADFGPDGYLYMLERAFGGPLGFASRIRRFNLTSGQEETLLQTAYGRHDNLEGLSVWRDGAGLIRLSMISDDNFIALQRSELVEYRLRE